jgi:hypothetical protein
MSSKPQKKPTPPMPENPFPRTDDGSWAGITDYVWQDVLTEFNEDNPCFDPTFQDEEGNPGNGEFQSVRDDTLFIKKQIRYASGPNRDKFRTFLQKLVNDTSAHIDSAVCLALGRLEHKSFVHQLAVFMVICDMFQEKQGNKTLIPRTFQDPMFTTGEEYTLCYNSKMNKVVKHPGALKYMTETSFVFAPHLTWEGFAETIIQTRPALYIGNKVEDSPTGLGVELAQRYIRQVYTTGRRDMSQDQLDLIKQTDSFSASYKKYRFDSTFDKTYRIPNQKPKRWHFLNTFVHIARENPHVPVLQGREASNPASHSPRFGFSKLNITDAPPSSNAAEPPSGKSDDLTSSILTDRKSSTQSQDSTKVSVYKHLNNTKSIADRWKPQS